MEQGEHGSTTLTCSSAPAQVVLVVLDSFRFYLFVRAVELGRTDCFNFHVYSTLVEYKLMSENDQRVEEEGAFNFTSMFINLGLTLL